MSRQLPRAFIEEMRSRIEEARKTIDVVKTVKVLQQCRDGEVLLSKEQIRASEILLKKSMPDLKEIEHTGEVDHKHVAEITIRAVDADRSTPQGG